MEPMTLGSPTASPAVSPAANANFLPEFLLGETQASTPRNNGVSPSRTRTVSFRVSTPANETRRSLQQKFCSPDQEQSTTFNHLTAINEKSGPPSKGLFDTVDSPTESFMNMSKLENRNYFTSPIRDMESKQSFTPIKNLNYTKNVNESFNYSFKNPNISSSCGSLWVTVLGFPPHAASLVLTQFAQCGTIIDKNFPADGNWINLKYSSEYEAAKALAMNGKLISNNIMIGVIQCNNFEDNKENSTRVKESLRESFLITSPNRARPLVQAYSPKPNSPDVTPRNVPHKANGLVSKAMEYVFGW